MAAKESEYLDIVITDLQIHRQKATNPKSVDRAMRKAARSGKPGRAFTNQMRAIDDRTFEASFPLTPELQSAKEEAERQGKKLRIWVPEGGVNVYLAPDAIEFLQSRGIKSKTKLEA